MEIKIKVSNRGGHQSRFDCNLIEVVTKAGLTVDVAWCVLRKITQKLNRGGH